MRDYISLFGESRTGVILDADSLCRIMILSNDQGVTIENLTLKSGFGGAIGCGHSDPNISNVIITGNTAERGGGAYFGYSNPTLSNVIISNNTAQHYGGGVYFGSSNPTLSNVIISNNTAGWDGGGISCTTSAPSLFNVTISNNSAYSSAGLGNAILVNSIVWNNRPAYVFASTVLTVYSNIQGGWPGIGNINADPMFVDTANGDYRLQAGSPCIDAGIQDTMIIYNNGLDTLIVPPMVYMGFAPDMGAYEFDPASVVEEKQNTPLKFSLKQNYPNPFNLKTHIQFSIPNAEFVTLKIYNLLGQEVITIVSEKLTPGNYKYIWNASDFASGIYYFKLETDKGLVQSKKLILLK
jgi:parallel beta-helix repeat protein